ncbi:hypothetical protein F4823DRAFT_566931 [Ustulina deusta]|nr:hypothetical protein F4823DRAFT_566931 [Ustulina deusta]
MRTGQLDRRSCVLGLDFGCFSSKLTIAYDTALQDRIHISRVGFIGGFNHPERVNLSSASAPALEFIAYAAPSGSKLITGRRSLHRDKSIPLKTVMTHLATGRETTVKGMPKSELLLREVGNNAVGEVSEQQKKQGSSLEAARIDKEESTQTKAEQYSQEILDRVTRIDRKLCKAPELGETGYIALHCQAPPDWTPATYESRISRAAWFYISIMGSPDEGVSADEEAMEKTAARFPDLPQDHILIGIKSVHMQAYHRPLDL